MLAASALTTDRSMTPGGSRPQGCRFADGDGRACLLNGPQGVRPDQPARHKLVDPDGPVTEVLSVGSESTSRSRGGLQSMWGASLAQ
jgi:hypothetical protein